jgi:hypothetical protein
MLIRVMIDEPEKETETLMLFPIGICAPVV